MININDFIVPMIFIDKSGKEYLVTKDLIRDSYEIWIDKSISRYIHASDLYKLNTLGLELKEFIDNIQ